MNAMFGNSQNEGKLEIAFRSYPQPGIDDRLSEMRREGKHVETGGIGEFADLLNLPHFWAIDRVSVCALAIHHELDYA